jgi:small conductance mechanosensitive channel
MSHAAIRTLVGRLPWLVLTWLLTGLSLVAQSPATTAPTTKSTPEPTIALSTLETLLVDLEDPARRQELTDRLRALLAAARPSTEVAPAAAGGLLDTAVSFLQHISEAASHTVAAVVAQLTLVPERLRRLEALLADPETRQRLLVDAGFGLLVIAMALLALLLVRHALRGSAKAMLRPRPAEPGRRIAHLGWLSLHWLLLLAAPLAALITGFLGLSLLPMSPAARAVALAALVALVTLAALRRTLAAVFVPARPECRAFAVDHTYATGLVRLLVSTAAAVVAGFFVLAIAGPLGADQELVDALRGIHGLVVLVASVVVVLRLRAWPRPAAVVVGPEAAPAGIQPPAAPTGIGSVLRGIGQFWWVGALVYAFGLYAMWVGGLQDAYGTALGATGWTIVYVAIGIGVHVLVTLGLRRAHIRLEAATRNINVLRAHVPHYLAFVRIACAVVTVLIVAGYVFEVWQVQALVVLQSKLLQSMLTTGLGILAVFVLAFGVIDVTTALTDGLLMARARTGGNTAKLRTLVPLSQKAIRLVVWVLATVTVMGQVGISIGPVLASIGVLGLAVGFGAQTLVKDVITGVFILIEDTVAVGDIVKIDDIGGVVEVISIRTIRLRGLDGSVHTIPYSTVGRLANMTKEYSCYLIEAGVAYREDTDEVCQALRDVGAELQADPVYGVDILEPVEIIGVDRFEASAVIVRARLKTRPSRQWAVGREFNRRMKKLFEQRGIEIPFPHRTIYFGVDKDGTAPPLPLPPRAEGAVDRALRANDDAADYAGAKEAPPQ